MMLSVQIANLNAANTNWEQFRQINARQNTHYTMLFLCWILEEYGIYAHWSLEGLEYSL